MKIVYLLATTSGWGGLEKHVFDVAQGMADRGHEVSVLCAAQYQEYAAKGVTIEPFDWSGSRHNPLLWLRLRKHLAKLTPDVVHAQANKPAYILSKSGCPKGAAAVGTVHNLKSYYRDFKKMDALIAVSRVIAKQANHQNTTVVYNGVKSSDLNSAAVDEIHEWQADKPKPLLLSIGRLVEAKGFDLLLEAWPQDANASLVILGEGKARQELEGIIARRSLKNVFLWGYSSLVAEWISVADMLVISSRNEGGPYVLPEAIMQDLPVVSTNVGMVSDFLPATNVVPAGSVEALNKLLSAVLSDVDYYRQQCQSVIAKAKQELTIEHMMASMEKVYLSLK